MGAFVTYVKVLLPNVTHHQLSNGDGEYNINEWNKIFVDGFVGTWQLNLYTLMLLIILNRTINLVTRNKSAKENRINYISWKNHFSFCLISIR